MRDDDIVVGGGHNGMVAAAYLARAGRRVLGLGAGRPGWVARRCPSGSSPGSTRAVGHAYLLSLLPRRIAADLDLDLRLVRRRVASYTPRPTDPRWGLLVDHGDPQVTARSFEAMTLGTRSMPRGGTSAPGWAGWPGGCGRPSCSRCARRRPSAELVDDDPLWMV